jgi:putative intracellular protease/amidase/YHS domain-containing protein
MKRREFLQKSAAIGIFAAIPSAALAGSAGKTDGRNANAVAVVPLEPPAEGSIPVAFLVSDGAVVIDFCGPWEVFQDAYIPGRKDAAFRLYTVAETDRPIEASGGMKIVPDFTYATAPAPKVIVIPAQSARSDATVAWIRKAAKTADVTMSVCTGAFLLAKTGLLAGKSATTHHSSYKPFAMQFSDVRLRRGARFVDEGSVASAGGLSSGIDLALHVVERYFGREAAEGTAFYMEYQGKGWREPGSNAVYARDFVSTEAHPLCAVCGMDVDKAKSPKSVYKGKTYYFCGPDHKAQFDEAPAKWI